MDNVNVNKIDYDRKYKLGTLFLNEIGGKFQYAKVDFGVVGKTKNGKVLRHIRYMWFPKNKLAGSIRRFVKAG